MIPGTLPRPVLPSGALEVFVVFSAGDENSSLKPKITWARSRLGVNGAHSWKQRKRACPRVFVSPNGSHLPPMYTCRATAAN